MGVSLGVWLMRMLHGSQLARNALFPDLASSPEVIFAAMALSMALDEVPMRNMMPSLVAVSLTLGRLLADSV